MCYLHRIASSDGNASLGSVNGSHFIFNRNKYDQFLLKTIDGVKFRLQAESTRVQGGPPQGYLYADAITEGDQWHSMGRVRIADLFKLVGAKEELQTEDYEYTLDIDNDITLRVEVRAKCKRILKDKPSSPPLMEPTKKVSFNRKRCSLEAFLLQRSFKAKITSFERDKGRTNA